MDYTGDVTVGGPADVRELPGLTITKLAVGPMSNDAYLLRCRATGRALLVDAAAEPARLLAQIADGGPRDALDTVVTTHQHADHWQGISEVVAATGAVVAATAADAPGLPEPVGLVLGDGDELRVGEVPLRVITLVGHTPGSLALYLDADGGHLFTGDSLFPGGPGNTDRDPARFDALMTDLETKVFGVLPDSTWVYPGHGADTTLGAEQPHLADWRERGW